MGRWDFEQRFLKLGSESEGGKGGSLILEGNAVIRESFEAFGSTTDRKSENERRIRRSPPLLSCLPAARWVPGPVEVESCCRAPLLILKEEVPFRGLRGKESRTEGLQKAVMLTF